MNVISYACKPVTIVSAGIFSGSDGFAARLTGIFKEKESGQVFRVPGFYCGNSQWAVRFSAQEPGTWEYHIVSDDIQLLGDLCGTVEIVQDDHVFPRPLRTKGFGFATSEDEPHFMSPFECDFLFSLVASPDGHEKLHTLVDNMKAYGFNQIVVNSFAWDSFYFRGRVNSDDYGPPYVDLWIETENGRSMNPAYFEHFDYMMNYLHQQGMYVQIYLRVYNKAVKWDEKYSQKEEDYLRTFVARYAAYTNVIWDITKEGYFEKDKQYIYHLFSLVQRYDPFKRLKTIHDDDEYALDPRYEKTVDFLTVQKYGEFSYMVMYYRLRSGKPVVTGELGTDHQRALRCMTDDRNMEPEGEQYDEKDYAKNAWQNLMGGGYACYYNRYMCWDVIEYDSVPRGFQYFKLMRDFFAPFDLSEFTPAPELSAWSGVVLDDRKTKILLYMEPKHDDRYNFFDRAVTLLNPANGRKYIRFTAFGIFSGKTQNISPQPPALPGSDAYDYMADNIHLDMTWIEEPVVIIGEYELTH